MKENIFLFHWKSLVKYSDVGVFIYRKILMIHICENEQSGKTSSKHCISLNWKEVRFTFWKQHTNFLAEIIYRQIHKITLRIIPLTAIWIFENISFSCSYLGTAPSQLFRVC